MGQGNIPIQNNNSAQCPVSNNPLIIPIFLPPLPPLQKGGKKIYLIPQNIKSKNYDTAKNKYPNYEYIQKEEKKIYLIPQNIKGGHYYDGSVAPGNQYPGYEYLQKYMDHYTALKNQNNQNDNKKQSSNTTNKSNDKKQDSDNKQKSFNVPTELKLTLNLDKDEKKQTIDSPQDDELKKIVKELEEQVSNKLNNIEKDTKTDLSSNLQSNIREEIKQNLLREMKDEIKKKISGYLATMVSAQTKDNINFAQPSIYQDTVPPFYGPGIVLP